MAKHEESIKQQHEEGEEELSGTLASVMLLGGFLIVSWVGVLILYLIR
ncbi:MAG TPA: cytochrome c oxidase subunit 2A [Bacillota bacterium]|nr:cytochrome c oxidase subunit 2A [Bacillota bacterium]